MAHISVSQLKPGAKLQSDVLTKLNNTLLYKGTVITERELEILKAFLIPSVHIEGGKDEEGEPSAAAAAPQTDNPALPFQDHYQSMLKLMKRVFNTASSGGLIPVLEIRTALEQLIQHIDSYHILSFSPKSFQLNDFIYHNSIMVSLTSYCLAKWHGLPAKDLMPVALAGLLHDIGNAKIDSAILFKPDRLSHSEIEEMKQHTIIGYNMLKSVTSINEGVKLVAIQHHEREDGSGYPFGIKGSKIHRYSKIVAISDVFHAMTTDRFHKKRSSPYLTLEQLQGEAFGKLEPTLVQTFIHKVTQFHHGTLVRLSDNRIGEIVFSDRVHPTRPWVNVNGKIINLTVERNLYIQSVIEKNT